MPDPVPAFDSEQDAIDHLAADFDAADNADDFRIGYLDDPAGMAKYAEAAAAGCCGSAEVDVTIAGRPAKVGCNYGH